MQQLNHTDGFRQLLVTVSVALLFTAGADSVGHLYTDPLINSPTTFQQRVAQMTSLEAETRRFERNMAIATAAAARLKRKPPTTTTTTTTANTAARDS